MRSLGNFRGCDYDNPHRKMQIKSQDCNIIILITNKYYLFLVCFPFTPLPSPHHLIFHLSSLSCKIAIKSLRATTLLHDCAFLVQQAPTVWLHLQASQCWLLCHNLFSLGDQLAEQSRIVTIHSHNSCGLVYQPQNRKKKPTRTNQSLVPSFLTSLPVTKRKSSGGHTSQ